jgi:glutaconate CoA-transferase subunit A
MSKVKNLEEAVNMVTSGSKIAIGGVAMYRKPMAFLRGLIKSGVKDLELITFFSGIDVDMLIANGSVKKVNSPQVSLDMFGLAPNFRRAVQGGFVEAPPHSEQTILWGITAAYMNLPFIPSRSPYGSDVMKLHPEYKIIDWAETNEKLVAIPPLKPDLAIIFAQRADANGNTQLEGAEGLDFQFVKAADKTIVLADQVVPPDIIKQNPEKTKIPGFYVDSVVRVPFGAHPTSCYPYYTYDLWHIFEYIDSTKDPAKMSEYLDKYVKSVQSHEEYLNKAGGATALLRIKL